MSPQVVHHQHRVGLVLAQPLPEIDHRIGKGFEGVMQLTEAIEARQEPAEFVFPSKNPLKRLKTFLKARWVPTMFRDLTLI